MDSHLRFTSSGIDTRGLPQRHNGYYYYNNKPAGSLEQDHNSAIALGVILVLTLAVFAFFSIRCIRRRRRRVEQDAADLERQLSGLNSIHASTPHSLSHATYSTLKGGLRVDSHNPGSRASVSTVSRGSGSLSRARREMRWWGSVAAHGSTGKADGLYGVEDKHVDARAGTRLCGRCRCEDVNLGDIQKERHLCFERVEWEGLPAARRKKETRGSELSPVEPALTRGKHEKR
ncbi:hypothetical protein EJ04DRAFT_607914 [Polyplosphaeria fusca]|uniref:Uncharacterized protein n=1 Tax=Polyplosphaeria fusca TaxID=682080 RepID=A0A9P4V8G6_9PLEO|nr:hypothetical protein EJ04DRAFT_607914 [Polyplosphaeria fusca]